VLRGRSPQFQARLKKVLKYIRARDADLVRLSGNGLQALQKAIVEPNSAHFLVPLKFYITVAEVQDREGLSRASDTKD
jgi:hypothetical protein